jgi:hypothetical protein
MEITDPSDSANFPGERRKNPLISSEEIRLKGIVTRVANSRVKAFERVKRFVPLIEEARKDIKMDFASKAYEKGVSNKAIAEWLNRYWKENGRDYTAPRGGDWSSKQLSEDIFEVPSKIIDQLVLECRTRMTARALSADFRKPLEGIAELEREYLEYIADALELEHRLNGYHPLMTRERLLQEARHTAIQVAADQRRQKELSMMARERLWNQFPPVVRKVFQQTEEPQS